MYQIRNAGLVLLLFMGFWAVTSAVHAADALACTGSSADSRHYFEKNFLLLYSKKQETFWATANKVAETAQQCKSSIHAVRMLRWVDLESRPADFEEFLSEQIELLCVQNPSCFGDAFRRVGAKTHLKLIERLQHPMFFDETMIKAAKCAPLDDKP